MIDRFENLTETQRRLLRLVAQGHSSKAISREVSLEPSTIDVYLSQAIKLLGAADRFEAARALAQHETILNRSKLRPEGVASAALSPQLVSQRKLGSLPTQLLKLPPLGGREHDYDLPQRLIVALKAAGLGFVTVIALTLTIAAIFWAIR